MQIGDVLTDLRLGPAEAGIESANDKIEPLGEGDGVGIFVFAFGLEVCGPSFSSKPPSRVVPGGP